MFKWPFKNGKTNLFDCYQGHDFCNTHFVVLMWILSYVVGRKTRNVHMIIVSQDSNRVSTTHTTGQFDTLFNPKATNVRIENEIATERDKQFALQ